jgi:hypothetical protein
MAIIDLQRSIAQVGRIRIGQQVPTEKGSRPTKLDTFRLTSPHKDLIETAARLYGGTVQPWQAPAGNQWEVITTTDRIRVLVPPTDMAYDRYYELWSRAGCQRRCDGQQEFISDGPCLCDPEQRQCNIHARLSLLLRDVPGFGIWRLDTSGYYAATELQGAVDFIKLAADRGTIVPATLRLEQRVITRPEQGTRRFAVPVLHPDMSLDQLAANSSTPLRLDIPDLRALASVTPQDAPTDTDELVDTMTAVTRLGAPPDTPPEPDAQQTARQRRRAAKRQAKEDDTPPPPEDTEQPPAPPLTPVPAQPRPSIADQLAATKQDTQPTRHGAAPITTNRPNAARVGVSKSAIHETHAGPTAGFAKPPGPWRPGQPLRPHMIDGPKPPPPPDPNDPRTPGPNQMGLDIPDLDTPPPDELISAADLTKLLTLLNAAGFTDTDTQLGFLTAATNREITDPGQLTSNEAGNTIEILEIDAQTKTDT